MPISERQREILKALIRDYIDEAEPVSSEGLQRRYRFKVSPATIRNEFLALEHLGFLAHLHTSSGRVPTDQGYRTYVNDLLEPSFTKADEQALIEAIGEASNRLAALCEVLARRTRTYVQAFRERGEAENFGLSLVFREPEFQEHQTVLDFTAIADELRQATPFFEELPAEPTILIGRELQRTFRQGESLTLVTMVTSQGNERTTWLVLGPKRMLYPKVMGLLNFLRKFSPAWPIILAAAIVNV